MILVDTSVWVDHLRHGVAALQTLLMEGLVLCHPFIVGELACGRLENRREILALLSALPQATLAEPDEALIFIDHHRLGGSGLGWVDINLLASAVLAHAPLWTVDRALVRAAQKMELAYRHSV